MTNTDKQEWWEEYEQFREYHSHDAGSQILEQLPVLLRHVAESEYKKGYAKGHVDAHDKIIDLIHDSNVFQSLLTPSPKES